MSFYFFYFCCYWNFFFVFFFFKQKTAYEMRISDWSSDVCSSDLSLNLSVHLRLVVVMGYLLSSASAMRARSPDGRAPAAKCPPGARAHRPGLPRAAAASGARPAPPSRDRACPGSGTLRLTPARPTAGSTSHDPQCRGPGEY